MYIEGCQAELTAHAPTTVRPWWLIPSFQRAARAPLTGFPCSLNSRSQAKAREQGRRHLLRKGEARNDQLHLNVAQVQRRLLRSSVRWLDCPRAAAASAHGGRIRLWSATGLCFEPRGPLGALHLIKHAVRLRCSCLRRLTDVHGSGTLWSFTKELMALGPAPWMYSPKPWQLGAGTDRVASDLDVSALSTSHSSRFGPNIGCLCVSMTPWYEVKSWLCCI